MAINEALRIDRSALTGVQVARRTVVVTAAAAAWLVVLDALVGFIALPLSFWFHLREPVFVWPAGSRFPTEFVYSFQPYVLVMLIAPLVRVLAAKRYGLYRLRGEFSILSDALAIFKAATGGSLVIILVAFLYHGGYVYAPYSYSRKVFVIDWAIVLVGLTLVRAVVRAVQIAYRRHERNLIPTLIVGEDALAELCVSEITARPRFGYRVVGAVTASERKTSGVTVGGVPVLGSFDSLPALIRQYGIEEVLITDQRLSPQALFEAIMRAGRTHRVNFRVVPNLFNCLPRKTDVDQIGTLPMIKLFEEPLAGPSRFLKRSVDIVGALVALAVTAPAWAVLAFLIKRESPGPVFFAQERVGMDGKVFPMFKFRSMTRDADTESKAAIHKEVMRKNITGQLDDNPATFYGKVPNDPRVTRIGGWMRRFSVDELPNILNVLRGEMSLVGPRPPIPYEVEVYQDWHRSRFHVKPGITGLWQVSGRNRLKFNEMVQLDVYYIENWSLWLDLKILLKTLPVVMRGDNTN
jgi:exopolysaccharide biosynthesis polyprenyl glycosylphosphotransferase